MNALLRAVRDILRAKVPLTESECEIMTTGKPPVFCGDWFYAVHEGPMRNQDTEHATGLDELYGAFVTITRRSSFAPEDLHGREVLSREREGLQAAADKARILIGGFLAENGYAVMDAANELIGHGNEEVNGFSEPLRFFDMQPVEEKGPPWFSARGRGIAGLAKVIRFGNARRVQTFEGAT